MKSIIRSKWHVVIGAGLAWVSPEHMIVGAIFFVAYQFLQCFYLSRHRQKDDSYKDIFDTGIAFGVSALVLTILRTGGVI